MSEDEHKLYWRGFYFPGTLSNDELVEWSRIVHKLDSVPEPTEEKQEHWGRALFAFAILLALVAVFL